MNIDIEFHCSSSNPEEDSRDLVKRGKKKRSESFKRLGISNLFFLFDDEQNIHVLLNNDHLSINHQNGYTSDRLKPTVANK